jgi:hypothetical protein
MSSKNEPGRPTRQMSPDADLAKMFAVGCGIVFVLFLCGWATIALFWMA